MYIYIYVYVPNKHETANEKKQHTCFQKDSTHVYFSEKVTKLDTYVTSPLSM